MCNNSLSIQKYLLVPGAHWDTETFMLYDSYHRDSVIVILQSYRVTHISCTLKVWLNTHLLLHHQLFKCLYLDFRVIIDFFAILCILYSLTVSYCYKFSEVCSLPDCQRSLTLQSFSNVVLCHSNNFLSVIEHCFSFLVSKPAPYWEGTAVINGEFKELKLTDYRGKYLVFFFYPLDL